MKPIETGCPATPDGQLRPADALALEQAAHSANTPSPHSTPNPNPNPNPNPTNPNPGSRSQLVPVPVPDQFSDPRARGEDTRTAEPITRNPGSNARDDDEPPTPLSCVYRFRAPLAPSVAAEMEGRAVALAPILRAADRLRSLAPDLLLVEGAGGLLVPITDTIDMADLVAALRLPLLVVARDGLGTINHTLLTLEATARRGLEVAAVVFSASSGDTSAVDAARNAQEIARRSQVPVLGRLPRLADTSPAALARAAEANLDLSRLLGAGS